MSDKKTRKELLKQEDAFLAAANQSAVWLKHHRTIVIGSVAAVVVLVAGVWIGVTVSESRRVQATQLFGEALDVRNAEVAADPSKAAPTATPPVFASKTDRAKAARDAFQKVVDQASSSGAADLARFYVADLDVTLGEADKALPIFQKLGDDLSPEDSLYFLAVERAAYLLEQKGDTAGAIRTWEKLTGSNKRFYADHALYQLARIHADKGEVDKARELLGRIEKDFPTSSVMPKVEELYARVGRPEAGASTADAGTPKKP